MLQEIKKLYKPFNNFLVRTPLLPLQVLESFTEENLKQHFRNPVIGEAIFLASPVLHSECIKWINNEIKEKKEETRIIYSLMRYLLRMSTRCTPFGLFAGCTVGEWVEANEGQIANKEILQNPQSKYKSHTRLDMHYLCALSQNLTNNSIIREKLKFFPNSSIYKYGKQLRYVEYHYIDKKRVHHLVAIDDSEYIQAVLKATEKGSKINILADLLIDNEIDFEEAKEFINELISSQVLVSELEPAITGHEFLEQLLKSLNEIEGIEEIKDVLSKTKQDIENIDSSELGIDVKQYLAIAEDLRKLETDYELSLLFQTDMVKPAKTFTFDKSFTDDILNGIAVMNKFTSMPVKTNLTEFKDAFYERYEDKEISLVDALDTETGIGYIQGRAGLGDIAPLVDEVGTPPANNASVDIHVHIDVYNLTGKLIQVLYEGDVKQKPKVFG